MKKLLVLFAWFASVCAVAASTSPIESLQLIKLQDAKNPDFVIDWLINIGPKINQKEAKQFYSLGLKAKKSKNWSAATKMFGESMIRYPSPHALYETADSELKMLKSVRAREKFPQWRVKKDMTNALDLYESSLAANKAINTLSSKEVERIEQHVSCIKNYLLTSKLQTGCSPTVYFSDDQMKKIVR